MAVRTASGEGKHIHEQDERPNDEGDFRKFEDRDKHQHQCGEYGEEVTPPGLGLVTPLTAPQQCRQNGMENSKDEIKRQSGVEQFIGQ